MRTAVIFCLFLVTVSGVPFSREWSRFKSFVQEYDKPYRNDSRTMVTKFEAFKQSLLRHDQLNLIESQRKGKAVYGVNKFSDLTQQEFKSMYLSVPRSPLQPKETQASSPITLSTDDIPVKFDWRNRNGTNVVSSINNQEYCGSCWAFSVVETMESALSIQTAKKPQKLSVQQLISCETDSNKLDGCKGGEIIYAFEKIVNSTVIVDNKVYPFTSSDGKTGSCKSNLPKVGVMLQDFVKMYKVDEKTDMTALVAQISPTSNAVNAAMWQDYKEGIIQHHCSESVLDHAIQVVGYSLSNDPIPYWIVRNTWGKDWGEDGYLRLSLGHNTCGIGYEVAAVSKVRACT